MQAVQLQLEQQFKKQTRPKDWSNGLVGKDVGRSNSLSCAGVMDSKKVRDDDATCGEEVSKFFTINSLFSVSYGGPFVTLHTHNDRVKKITYLSILSRSEGSKYS